MGGGSSMRNLQGGHTLGREAGERRSGVDRRGRAATVLGVEDDPDVRELAAEVLEQCGYRVLQAADGQEALATLRDEGEIDILFTDIVMPGGINGAQVAAAAIRLQPGIKVLFASGYAGQAVLD